VTITVRSTAPILFANNDTFYAIQNTPLEIAAPGVLKNDLVYSGDATNTAPGTAGVLNLALNVALVTNVSHGTLQLGTDGRFNYLPAKNFYGADTFTYKATIAPTAEGTTPVFSSASHNVATVTIYVAAPQAVNDFYSTLQDTTLGAAAPGVLANDKAAEGHKLSSVLISSTAHGDLALNADGSFTYKPVAGYLGPDTFTYRAVDTTTLPPGESTDATTAADVTPSQLLDALNRNIGGFATVTIFVKPPAPIVTANNDFFETKMNVALEVPLPGVLRNDYVLVGDPVTGTNGTTSTSSNYLLVAVLASRPTNGTVELHGDGSFHYVPNDKFTGTDTFTYQAYASTSATTDPNIAPRATATVTINVKPIVVTPVVVAQDDGYQAAINGELDVPASTGVLRNDYVTIGDPTTNALQPPTYPLTAVLADKPGSGTVELHNDGSFHYVPDPNFEGTDTFTYRAVLSSTTVTGSNAPPSDLAMVSIKVSKPLPRPQAIDDFYSTPQGTTLKVAAPGVIGNDKKPIDGSRLAAVIGSLPAHGEIVFTSDGSFTYTPARDFTGTDTFTYQDLVFLDQPTPPSGDPNQYISDFATVSINVKPVNTAPIAVANNDTFEARAGAAIDVPLPGVLKNDYVVFDNPTTGGSNNITSGNTTSPSTIPLSAVLISQPGSGTLELHRDGSFHYVPKDGFTGSDTFTYRAVLNTTVNPPPTTGSDSALATHDVATVTINVRPVATSPVAVDDSYTTLKGTTLRVAWPGVTGNDKKEDGATLLAVMGTFPAHGKLEFHSDGSFSYMPASDFTGTDTFTYQDLELLGSPATSFGDPTQYISNFATVTITVKAPEPPPGPLAVNDYYFTAENTALGIGVPGVLANDIRHFICPPLAPCSIETLAWGAQLTSMLVDGPSHGVLSFKDDGSFRYSPEADFTGIDTFTYQVSQDYWPVDGTKTAILSNVATVTIRVLPAVAHNDSYVMGVNTVLDVGAPGVLSNDSGGSTAHPLVATLLSAPSHGTLHLGVDGSIHYEPAANYVGSDMFSYRVGDGTATIDPATGAAVATTLSGDTNRPVNAFDVGIVKIYVRPPAPKIEAHDDKYLTREDTALSIDSPGVLANDYGPVNVPVVAAVVSTPAHGTLALGEKGGFTYTPDAGFVGEDKFTYSASVAAAAGSTSSSINSGLATVVIYVVAPEAVQKVIVGGDQRTTDESGPQKIIDYASVLAVEDNGAPPTITVTTDKPGLFSSLPSIDPAGQLVYTPAPNASGTANISVVVSDPTTGEAGDATSFTIHIDKPHAFTNSANRCDVTDDSNVAADDVVSIINYINAHGSSLISEVPTNLIKRLFYDVDKDNWIAATDVLTIINYINAHPDQPTPSDAIDPSLLMLVAQDAAEAVTGKKRT